jgi:uncharacterized protein YjaG (DUF416 family)
VLPAFDDAVLKKELGNFGAWGQRAFGALCCERLLPNYVAFQNEVKWGDSRPLRSALDLVWRGFLGQAVSQDEIKRLAAVCEALAPSSDDFDALRTASAEDACFAICSLLDHLITPDVGRVVQTAVYATDSIDLFVQEIEELEPSDRNLELIILKHPLMQRELLRQKDDLESIRAALASGDASMERLAALRRADERGNLESL